MQWLMLQQEKPEDFVIATGRMETVRNFIEISAKYLKWNKEKDGPAIIWEGEGIDEVGRRADTYEIIAKLIKDISGHQLTNYLVMPQKQNKLGCLFYIS